MNSLIVMEKENALKKFRKMERKSLVVSVLKALEETTVRNHHVRRTAIKMDYVLIPNAYVKMDGEEFLVM